MSKQPKAKQRRTWGGPPKQCKCGFKPEVSDTRGWRRRDSSLQCPQCGATVYNHI